LPTKRFPFPISRIPLNLVKRIPIIFIAACLAATAQATSYTFLPVDTFGGDTNVNDLGDLAHGNAYTWGISNTALKNELSSGYQVQSAVLTIKNIYNWSTLDTSNVLYIHLLDNPLGGTKAVTDDPTDNGVNQGVQSDYFGGALATNRVNNKYVAYGYANTNAATVIATGATNTYLTQYHDANGPTTKDQFSFAFSASQLTTLRSYIINGHTGGTTYADFGMGFDPDCHFYNDGIQLTLTTGLTTYGNQTVPAPDAGMTLPLLGLGLLGLVGGRRLFRA
jgi:hypothetical protein